MDTKKEIRKHLLIARNEIGEIKPWHDPEFNAWIFSHDLYPVEYAGMAKEEVIQNYPLYLETFIEERLNDNLSPLTEKETKGRAGKHSST